MRRNVLKFLGAQGSWGEGKEGAADPSLLCSGENLDLAESVGWTAVRLLPVLATRRLMGCRGNHISGLTRTGSHRQELALASQQRSFSLRCYFYPEFQKEAFSLSLPTSPWPWELGYSQHHRGRGACSWHQVSWMAVGKQSEVFLADKL